MRLVLVSLFLLILSVVSFLEAGDNQWVQPNDKYYNDTHSVVYVVYELPPEEEFKNIMKYTFQIVKQQEFDRFNFQVSLQNKIDSLSSSIKFMESDLDSLNNHYEVMKK